MKIPLPVAAVIVAAVAVPAHSQSVPDSDQFSEIVVEGTRLRDTGLADTTIVMSRGRHTEIRIEMRADGVFRSYLNGLDSDWGRWTIRDDALCFEGRLRESYCARGVVGRQVGDTWRTAGLDGLEYEAKLIAGT
jgi:hypothetical protein